MEPARRLAALTRLILEMRGADGAPRTADRAWPLAAELAALMDEAERAEIDLAAKLPDAADPEDAAHWARTLEFLHIVTAHWPQWLAEQGLMNPAARLVELLNAQAAAWEVAPPVEASAHCRHHGRHPCGRATCCGRSPACRMAPWCCLASTHGCPSRLGARWTTGHPQAGLAGLLHRLGATRDDVQPWAAANQPVRRPSRGHFAPGAVARRNGARPARPAIEGLSLLSAADQQEEATAIALVLRAALETSGATAALVTPDRDLAGRVATELLRYGVVADDSAGEPIVGDTTGGVL